MSRRGTFTGFGLLVLVLLIGSVSVVAPPMKYHLGPKLAASPGAWPTYHWTTPAAATM